MLRRYLWEVSAALNGCLRSEDLGNLPAERNLD